MITFNSFTRQCLWLIIYFMSPILSYGKIIHMPDSTFKKALANSTCINTTGDEVGDVDADLNDDGDIDEIWLYPEETSIEKFNDSRFGRDRAF